MSKEVMKLAIKTLLWANEEINGWRDDAYGHDPIDHPEIMLAIKALEEALAKQEQDEPLEYWNAVEGWVKLDEVRGHFDSVSCATIYKNDGEGRVPLCLAQPKQEQGKPVAWMHPEWLTYNRAPSPTVSHRENWIPLYTTPQQRKPLTDEQIFAIGKELGLKCRLGGNTNIDIDYARAIEAAHGIKE
jgi:hypothetical protein